MADNPSPEAGSSPPSVPSRTPAFLALACLVVLGVWWGVRAREGRALDRALAPYASAPLPQPGAPVDHALADLGARVFDTRCAGCHHMSGEPRLGPNLAGVTLARDAAWLRSMIMNPDSMTRSDPIARALLDHFEVRMMVAGGMDAAATRAVLEFLRRADGGGGH